MGTFKHTQREEDRIVSSHPLSQFCSHSQTLHIIHKYFNGLSKIWTLFKKYNPNIITTLLKTSNNL